jgi:hypothetical protein
MHLNQLVMFFANQGLMQTASYFLGHFYESVTRDGLIEADFVKRHVGDGDMWREIQSNVTTYIGCEK